jgi:nucleoside-diphosphate-sugar epimerase
LRELFFKKPKIEIKLNELLNSGISMKIAVTGASGFIGTNLCSYLNEKGYEVIPLVFNSDKIQGTVIERLNYRLCDVTDARLLKEIFKKIDIVIHLAALFNNPEASWDDYYRVNLDGTRNVLEAAKERGVSRVIHCSTVGVAQDGKLPYSEMTPYSPQHWDKYETTKCEGEKFALDFYRNEGLPIVVIRPAQVYGPGDYRKTKLYKMIKRGITVNPNKTLKHLIYVEDLCRALETAMFNEKAVGEVFIIAGEKATHLDKLVNLIAEELGVSPPKIKLPATPITWLFTGIENLCNLVRIKPPFFRRTMDFFTKSVEFDVSKAKEVLGFQARVDVKTGVAKTVAWYKETRLL